MKAAILAAMAILAFPASADNNWEDPTVVRASLEWACRALEVDCSEVPTPTVRIVPWQLMSGSWGTYLQDSNVIALSDDVAGRPDIEWVLIHEAAHAVDYHLGISEYRTPSGLFCPTEELAYRVSNLWLLEHRRHKQARWNWRNLYYGC